MEIISTLHVCICCMYIVAQNPAVGLYASKMCRAIRLHTTSPQVKADFKNSFTLRLGNKSVKIPTVICRCTYLVKCVAPVWLTAAKCPVCLCHTCIKTTLCVSCMQMPAVEAEPRHSKVVLPFIHTLVIVRFPDMLNSTFYPFRGHLNSTSDWWLYL